MTLRTRKIIYIALFVWMLLVFALASAVFIGSTFSNHLIGDKLFGSLLPTTLHSLYEDNSISGSMSANELRIVVESIFALIIAIVSMAMFIRFFRKQTDYQLLFVYLSISSFWGESLKLFAMEVVNLGGNPYLLLVFTRLYVGIYIFGLLSCFMAGLYISGIKFQHQGSAILIISVFAIGIATSFPINTSIVDSNYLYKPALYNQVMWVMISIMIISSLGYFSQLLDRFSREDMVRALSLSLLVFGTGLLFFSTSILGNIIALTMILIGIISYFIRMFYDYFWY